MIPDGVISIGRQAFSQCKKMASIEIPSSTESIGEYAFYSCDKLKSIVIHREKGSIPNEPWGCYRQNAVIWTGVE